VELSPAESAVGMAIGEHVPEPPLPPVEAGLDPRTALEAAIRPALQRPPCLVTFSGGRDSSTVLAVATSLARREALPLPIPITREFPEHPTTRETQWQELVIRHLSLPDWQRSQHGVELSWLGPVAQRHLLKHGLMAPVGTHVITPILEAAGRGAVLTGIEGDGLFNGGSRLLARDVLARRVPPTPRALLSTAQALSPAPVRKRWRLVRDRSSPAPWLRPEAARALRSASARQAGSEPLRWDRRVHWWARRRYLVSGRQAMAITATGFDAEYRHPLMDPGFLASVARWGGALGHGRRTALMRLLFGDLLPAAVIERTDKAGFTSAYWSGEVKEFAAGWSGQGVPHELVDAEALRRIWLEPEPDARSGLLLHAAWLATSGGAEVKQPVNCRLE
jgi:asparagine synthetase B (glutamine-hydrolysing)